METNCTSENGVNGTGASSESASPGREVGGQQPTPGRHQATARLRWNKEVNKRVMRCFCKSERTRRGYRKRMSGFWKEIEVFPISEQRLADQARAIRTNGWLSEVKLEEIKRELSNDVPHREKVDDLENERDQAEDGSTENERSRLTEHRMTNVEKVISRMEREGCNVDQIQLVSQILDSMKNDSEPSPNLGNIERRRLREKVQEVNKTLIFIETNDITETNELLLLAVGRVIAKRLGIKQRKRRTKREPWWKRRINNQIFHLRKDVSRLERLKSGKLLNVAVCEGLERRHHLKKKGVTL